MDPRRTLTERNAHFTRGPRFSRVGDVVMFEFVIDAGNVIGPRPATDADKAKHEGAWREFNTADALTALARDDADLLDGALDKQAAGALETIGNDDLKARLGLDTSNGQPDGQRARRGRKPRGHQA
jgi:hypothetical protein